MKLSYSTLFIVLWLFPPSFSNPLSQAAETQPAAVKKNVPELTVNQSDKRPADQFQTTIFNRTLTIGGELETKPTYQRDLRLGLKEDDLFEVKEHIELEMLYEFSDNTFLFLEGKAIHEKILYSEEQTRLNKVEFQRGEMWFFAEGADSNPWGIRIGRQNIREKREWWWDENLDALTLRYEKMPWAIELGIAEELAKISSKENGIKPENKSIFRLFSHSRWQWRNKQELAFFFLNQTDHSTSPQVKEHVQKNKTDAVDSDLTWLGLRALGRWKIRSLGNIHYWLDTGFVDGEETAFDFDDIGGGISEVDSRIKQDVQGFAFDLGATWESKRAGGPSLTVGYAVGSGDKNPNDDTDRSYRQTGLQDNNGRFRGVNRFRYYGELFRPELSNIGIKTIAIGFPILKNSSIEILFHRYHQVELQKGRLRNADIKAPVLGINNNIGHEIDFILGLEEWTHLEIEFIAAFFQAGDAFGETPSHLATMQTLQIDYNF